MPHERMQRIVIDTNVLVSALIQRSNPYFILTEVFVNTNIRLCLSDELFQEYRDALNREKFSKFSNFTVNAQMLLVDIEKISERCVPKIKIDLISDKDDNKLLELAVCCKADFLITGNHTDFTMPTYKTTKIVSPREYWTLHKPE